MSKQLIVSVSREYGSGGHIIAGRIAAKLNLPLYDYSLLNKIATEKNLNLGKLEKYDEKPKNKLFSRNVRGYSNSPEENIADLQFEYLREEAESGKSFVVLGRCAEAVLRDYSCMIPIFILADRDYKIERTMKCEKISWEEAEQLVHRQNKKRKEYHNYHCTGKWGDARFYDMTINCGRLGLEKTTDILIDYIQTKAGMDDC